MDANFKERFEAYVAKHEQGVVMGIGEFSGDVLERKEIDTLLKNEPKTFNLFILALRALKHKGDKDIMGFFQIASIHGYPLNLWNNVKGKQSTPNPGDKDNKNKDPNNDGYCPHSKNIFPTWHRPYLVMLEQALFIEMIVIATQYDGDDVIKQYIEAAMKFRLPYWDYWRPRGGQVTFPGVVDGGENATYSHDYSAPRIFTDQSIMVRMYPSNELKPILNPFWHYIFSFLSGSLKDNEWMYMDSYKGVGANLINRSQTSRHPFPVPTETTIQDVVWDNPVRMNSTLNEMRMDATRIALKMLSKSQVYGNYELFSCARTDSKTDPDPDPVKPGPIKPPTGEKHEQWRSLMTTSLEGIHNMYHIMIGGIKPGGHMSRVPTAAFDPIFWFHHNQIERLFSIWQSIHEGEEKAWFANKADASEPLTPFFKAPPEGDTHHFWDSEGVKSTKTFGYTYGDIKSTPDETIKELQRVYGWSVAFLDTETRRKAPPGCEPLVVSGEEFFQHERPVIPALLSENQSLQAPSETLQAAIESLSMGITDTLPKDETIWEWEIADQVQRNALDGSFVIMYFILRENDTTVQYDSPETAPTLAGFTSIFASPTETCINCKQQKEDAVFMRNAVAITSQLMDYVRVDPINLPSLEPDHVIPFLKKRLRWQIMDVNGIVRDPRDMKQYYDFHLDVVSYQSTIGERARGEYPDPVPHPEVFQYIVGAASPPTHDMYVAIDA